MSLVSHKVLFLRLILSRFRILVIGKLSLISHAFAVGKDMGQTRRFNEYSYLSCQ
ncbi:hypothetical protein BDR06DRAFT_708028 [Suillus hirtellus]|nr:hypothetical protein BDR06DRAFT_708028 [Suillus hirtellus]